MKFNENIFAVIVLYKTKLSDSKTFLSLTQSLNLNGAALNVLIYDNSPEFNLKTNFNYREWNITYIPDADNNGVSKAYNAGAKIAAQKGIEWIIIFDQDTVFPENTIAIYTKAIIDYPAYKIFTPIMFISENVIVSPCKFKLMRGSSLNYLDPGPNTFRNLSAINCGMCINLRSFEQNEGYNEKIRLDFSDHDFIKRFKNKVSEKFIVLDLKVRHDLSTTNVNSFESDLVRFDYYLEGAKGISSSTIEKYLLRLNAIVRALKLSIRHRRSLPFLVKVFK